MMLKQLKTLTFNTDKFSIYVLASVKKKMETVPVVTPSKSEDSSSNNTSSSSSYKVPNVSAR